MTASAMAAYGSQVTRKANTITTIIRATCPSTRFVLPASEICSLVTYRTPKYKQKDFIVILVQTVEFHMPNFYIAYLVEGPQESWVTHNDNGEGHGKAKWKVYDDVGHVPDIPAVPVRSAGGLNALQLKTSPTKQRWSVPHKRPQPGQQHSSNSVSEDNRDGVSHAVGAVKVLYSGWCCQVKYWWSLLYLVWNRTAPMG